MGRAPRRYYGHCLDQDFYAPAMEAYLCQARFSVGLQRGDRLHFGMVLSIRLCKDRPNLCQLRQA